jgi:serine phosphatase RsbU (regulator of sigma subunit)
VADTAESHNAKCRRHLETILSITRRLASEPRLDPMLEHIAEETCNLLDAERATLFLYDAAKQELYSRIATRSEIKEIRIPAHAGIAGAVAQAGGSFCLNIPDAYADPRFNREVDRQTGWRTRNILAVPLLNLQSELVGVLEVMNKRGGAFTGDDCDLLSALAAQAGVALERARLLEEFLAKRRLENEMELARDIQMGLLPAEPPPLAGFDLAGWSEPSEYAGGDFFDLFPWGDRRVGLMLGDAVGHGVGPALLAAETRALVLALAMHEDRPEQVLADTNRLLAQDVTDGRFVTLVLAAASTDKGSVCYASAGQAPLVVLRADGRHESLDATGLPLGILPEAPIQGGTAIRLDPGDTFLILSDGIYECDTADGGMLGMEAVLATARQHRSAPARALLEALERLTLETNPGGRFRDDRTAVIAKRTA